MDLRFLEDPLHVLDDHHLDFAVVPKIVKKPRFLEARQRVVIGDLLLVQVPADGLERLQGLLDLAEACRCGLLASPPPIDKPHHLAAAGPKLKDLRDQSGWTVAEIAERTGMPLDLLTAFENGDSAAAGELTSFDLERLASACCGTLADLLGPEHSWVKAARSRDSRVWSLGGKWLHDGPKPRRLSRKP